MKKKYYNLAFSILAITLILVPRYAFGEDETPTENPPVIEETLVVEETTSATTLVLDEPATEQTNETNNLEEVPAENTATSHITIRYQDSIIFDGDVAIPTATTFTYTDGTTHETQTTTTAGHSVLDLFNAADTNSDAFNLTSITYYSSFNSFLIDCIHLSQGEGTDACYNWKYVVNASYPFVGMNAYALSGGESIYLYFGDQYDLSTNKTTYEAGETISALFQEYDYVNNGWNPVSGTQILATDPVYPDWFNGIFPTTLASSTTHESGIATFSFTTTGTFFISLNELYSYWPSKTITIIPATTPTTTEENTGNNTGGNSGGGGGGSSNVQTFSIPAAVQFINTSIGADGSVLNNALLSDWASIGMKAAGISGETELSKIKTYLLSDPSPLVGANQTTDYARRAMALMAAGINPYTGTKTNYIEKLLNAFNGEQFVDQHGETGLVNDDIFALIALYKAGYGTSDSVIQKTVSFILSQEATNGSFGSVDLTAAAIQALTPISSLTGVSDALAKAKNYLHTNQASDGGFGDIYNTSWVLQAIGSLGETGSAWTLNGQTPNTYITKSQVSDGGVISGDTNFNRVWATTYAIPGFTEKSWNTILTSFTKPAVTTQIPSGSGARDATTTTIQITTSTIQTTTSTIVEVLESPTSTVVTSTLEQTVIEPQITEPISIQEVIHTRKTAAPKPAILGEQITNDKVTENIQTTSTVFTNENSEINQNNIAETEQKNPDTKKYIFITSLIIFLGLIGYIAFKGLATSKK